MNHRMVFLILVVVAAMGACCVNVASATVYHIEGQGTLSDSSPPFGVTGEDVTITIDLDTAEWFYIAVANPNFHYFLPSATVPVVVVGATSGTFPDVDPVQSVIAYEGSSGGNDNLDISNGASGGTTSVLQLFSIPASGFDGDLGPFTPNEMFLLLKAAIEDTNTWDPSFVNVFTGGADEVIFMDGFTWTMTIVPEPASAILAFAACCVLVAFGWRRRRRA